MTAGGALPAFAQPSEATALRSELARWRQTAPGLPGLDALEDDFALLEAASPGQPGAPSPAELRAKLLRQVEAGLKELSVREGESVPGDPTSSGNYRPRRALLLGLQELYKTLGRPSTALFPKGPPGRFVAVEEGASTVQYAYCDETLKVLARTFKTDVPGGGAAGGGAGGTADPAPTPTGGSEGGGAAPLPDLPAPTVRPVRAGGGPTPDTMSDTGRLFSWNLFARYSTWTVYALAGLAVLGLAYHLRKGASNLATLADRVHAGTGDDDDACAPADERLRRAVALFQKTKYKQALAVFRTVAGAAVPERQKAAYYVVLCQVRMDQRTAAAADLELVALEGLTADELYRLGTAFEEAGGLDVARRLYEHVRAKDGTFRDVLHRIDVLDKRAALRAGDGGRPEGA